MTGLAVAKSESGGAVAGRDPILDGAIVELMTKGDLRIPPYPAVAFQIRELIGKGDYGLDALGRLAASDQVVAADTLRVANSVMYSRGAPVTSVKQAVQRIGANELAQIALASRLGGVACEEGLLSPIRRRAWIDGLSGAFLCHALARARGLTPDEAFAAGLLHDFGRIIAVTCLERIVAARKDDRQRPAEAWEEIVDRYHVELGVVMAARWNLPAVLSEVISLHHADSAAGAAAPALVELVQAVDQVVGLLAEKPDVTEEDLGLISLLQGNEVDVALRAVQSLGGFIASFEGSGLGMPTGKSLVAPAAVPQTAAPAVAPKGVVLAVRGKAHRFKLVGVAPQQIVVEGPDAVPIDVLLEMMVDAEVPIEGHARVKLTWPVPGGKRHLVKPYALFGTALERWEKLVTTSAAA